MEPLLVWGRCLTSGGMADMIPVDQPDWGSPVAAAG